MKHLIISQKNGEHIFKFPINVTYYQIINNTLYVDRSGCQFRFKLDKYEYKIA